MSPDRITELKNTIQNNIVTGSILGAVAYFVNLGAMYLFLSLDGAKWSEAWNRQLYSFEILDMLVFTGQTLYNAHFVGTRFRDDTGSVTVRNFLTDSSIQENITSTVPEFAYHAVPILVLIVAGYLLFQRTDRIPSRKRAAMVGVTILVGYLPLSIGGVVVFRASGAFFAATPNPLPAILLAGIIYPLVGGAIGSTIGYEVGSG